MDIASTPEPRWPAQARRNIIYLAVAGFLCGSAFLATLFWANRVDSYLPGDSRAGFMVIVMAVLWPMTLIFCARSWRITLYHKMGVGSVEATLVLLAAAPIMGIVSYSLATGLWLYLFAAILGLIIFPPGLFVAVYSIRRDLRPRTSPQEESPIPPK